MTKEKDRQEPPRPDPATDEKGPNLGYTDDAGHPGGLPDLEHKTETEADHDDRP
ncbi:MAG: hypothetical protein FJ027_06190 [Candidatus Rokubacteria bacterium]|nr:hypothetical protein [Candidatus Rokubacteria bacterium]